MTFSVVMPSVVILLSVVKMTTNTCLWPHTNNTPFIAGDSFDSKIIALLQAYINFEHLLPPPHPPLQNGGRVWWFVYGESVFFQLLKNRDVFMAILSRRLMAESWQQDKPGSLQAFTGNWARFRLGAGWPPNRDGINERLRWSQTVPSIMHLIPAIQIVTVGLAHISLKTSWISW